METTTNTAVSILGNFGEKSRFRSNLNYNIARWTKIVCGIRNATLIYHIASETKSAEWHFYSRMTAKRTDEEGNFKLEGLPKEKVTIIARAPSYAEAR